MVEFYSTMNNGFDSLSSSSTATPSFADVEMPVGGNDTVAVQFIDFSQISGYMATFRGWMSIFIWFSVIWLCYERVIGLFNPNFKPTPPMSNNTINLSKGERIN